MAIVVGGVVNAAPFAPVLLAPVNAASMTLAGTLEVEWAYQYGTPGATQTAWAIRRKVSGGSTYSWWNTTTSAWQSTVAWNTGATQSYTFPAGAWANGTVYNVSVATEDVNGPGPYCLTNTLTGQLGPTVVVSAPGGTTPTSRPTVEWIPALATGASQITYRVRVFSAAQYGATGFTPATSTATYDSGPLLGNATSLTIPATSQLTNSTVFRAYVQVTQSGGAVSPWAYSAFTTSFTAPLAPTVVVTTGETETTGKPVNTITIGASFVNLLSAENANFETGIGGWVEVLDAAVSQSDVEYLVGSHSMQIEATAAHTASARLSNRPDVTPGVEYTVVASGLSDKAWSLQVRFEASTGGGVGTLAIVDVSASPDEWVQGVVHVIAPPRSATMTIEINVATTAEGQLAYFDCVGVTEGASTTWVTGGGVATTATVRYSDDTGKTWWPVRGATNVALPVGALTVVDREAPFGWERKYRATVGA